MNDKRTIRVIKREQRQFQNAPAELPRRKPATASRDVKTIVSGWVRECQQRRDFHPSFDSLFQKA